MEHPGTTQADYDNNSYLETFFQKLQESNDKSNFSRHVQQFDQEYDLPEIDCMNTTQLKTTNPTIVPKSFIRHPSRKQWSSTFHNSIALQIRCSGAPLGVMKSTSFMRLDLLRSTFRSLTWLRRRKKTRRDRESKGLGTNLPLITPRLISRQTLNPSWIS